MNVPREAQGTGHHGRFAVGAAALLCVALYFALASVNSDAYRGRPLTYNYYNLMVDGFLAGHVSVDIPPGAMAAGGEAERMHDVSVYKGKNYLYFSAVPAVLLFLPWKVLTGAHLAQYWAAAIFASGGYLALAALLGLLRRDFFPSVSPALLAASLLLLGIVDWWPMLLTRVGVWEVPISSAFCFASLAFLFVYLGARGAKGSRWLGAASLACGLAVVSRPNYIVASGMLLFPLLYLWRRERLAPAGAAEWTRRICAVALPIAAVGALAGAYNFARFGNPLDLGMDYISFLPGTYPPKHFSTAYVGANTWRYFLAPAHFSPWFPFFKLPLTPALPAGVADVTEDMWGLLANMPVLVLAAGLFLAGARGAASRLGMIAGALALAFAAMGTFLVLYCGANGRYEGEAMLGLPALAVLGIWTLETRAWAGGFGRRLARFLWAVPAVYSAAFVFCGAIQRDDFVRFSHPRAYRALARELDFPAFWYDRIHDVAYGPVKLAVRFPSGRPGNEPIAVTGSAPWNNVLYVHYADATHVQFGFIGGVTGTMLSPPIAVDYAAAHTLEASMGSFYPPRESPFFDFLPASEAAVLENTLFLSIDGTTVFRQPAFFFDAAARRPDLGRGRVVPGQEWIFTGTLTAR
ncbi:MAG TPA: hypothetical protein VII09_02125 [Opitutaceae bacterium]